MAKFEPIKHLMGGQTEGLVPKVNELVTRINEGFYLEVKAKIEEDIKALVESAKVTLEALQKEAFEEFKKAKDKELQSTQERLEDLKREALK